jgi:hypothetical protein
MNNEAQLSLVTQSGIWRVFNEVFWNSTVIKLGWDLFAIAPLSVNLTVRFIVSGLALFAINSIGPGKKLTEGLLFSIRTWAAGTTETILAIVAFIEIFAVIAYFAPYMLGIIILITTGLAVFFRIIILVLKAYIRILLNVIFSPMILLLNIIPGRSDFSRWIKTLAADLAVFPIIMVLFMISGVIAQIPAAEGSFWTPPFLGSAINPNSFRAILSVGILFMIPNIVESIRGIFGLRENGLGFGPGLIVGGLGGALATGKGIRAFLPSLPYTPVVGKFFNKYDADKKPVGFATTLVNKYSPRNPIVEAIKGINKK